MAFLTNLKTKLEWLIKEITCMYSSKDSFFSKKRIESGIAFIVAQWGMIFFLIKKLDGMAASDMLIWAGIEFAVAGYMINQIQKEKGSAASTATPTDSVQ